MNRLAVQFSAVQHRVSAASCGHDPEDDLDRNHAQVEEGCRDCPHFPSHHVNLTTRNHSTTRKSWRSDAPIILPGWEYHTGGSRSKPTVHRCRPKTGGCGLLARTQNEPTKQHGSGVENQHVHKRHEPQKKIDVMEDIDCVPSNVQSAHEEALLYVFQDNEAVIKMSIKRQKSYNETRFQNPQSCS